jgi:hypothetical protein
MVAADVVNALKICAKRGAEYFDEEESDWFFDIDLADFDINDYEQCVLGHLDGGYNEGLKKRGIDRMQAVTLGLLVPWQNDMGISINQRASILTEAWIDEIKLRVNR